MAAWALFRFRQARITLAPLLAKWSAVALPMPVLPPGEETPQGKNCHVALWRHWGGRIPSLCRLQARETVIGRVAAGRATHA